jgi:anti-sigma-K factor RskA
MSRQASGLDRERLRDLLADRATAGVTAAELSELERLASQYPDEDLDGPELAAAQLLLAGLTVEVMPERLQTRLLGLVPEPVKVVAMPRRTWVTWSGWAVAAAAMLITVMSWTSNERPAVSPEQAFGEWRGEGVVRWDWTAGQNPADRAVRGEVIWNRREQKGFMKFSGLEANDPKSSVYQLWIFDAERDERYPVDGGVFSVPNSGELVVPIHAKLPVFRPVLFAVTVEPPGGVVVSKRERIAALAKAI